MISTKRMKREKDSQERSTWRSWCRLCSAKNSEAFYGVFEKSENEIEATIATEIGKYFWVKIKNNDKLPQRVCSECYSLVSMLSAFTERVSKVQTMYNFLNNSTEQTYDEDNLFRQFGLLDDGWEHIVKPVGKDSKEILSYAEELLDDSNSTEADEFSVTVVKASKHQKRGREKNISARRTESFDSLEEETNSESELVGFVEPNDSDDGEIYLELKPAQPQGVSSEEESNYEVYEGLQQSEYDYDEEYEEIGLEKTKNRLKREPESHDEVLLRPYKKPSVKGVKYNCKLCSKKYKNFTFYRKHLSVAHSMEVDVPDITCEKCGRTFPTERQLSVHSRTHMTLEEKQVVPCCYCEKKFTVLSVMKQHVSAVHLNEKPYICDVCGRALKTLAAFNDHKQIHSEETPYECDVCHKTFKTKVRLKMHSDVHAEATYKCPNCDLTLSTKRTLKMHMLVHSDAKEHKCDFCGAEFKRSKALKNHLILHTGIRPYKCNFCNKTFTNGSNCRAHKKKLHPQELADEEAQGVKIRTKMPKIEELKSRGKAIKTPLPIRRVKGGLSDEMRALLIAAEARKNKGAVTTFETINPDDAGESSLQYQDQVVELLSDTDATTTLIHNIEHNDHEESDHAVIYEVIDEIN